MENEREVFAVPDVFCAGNNFRVNEEVAPEMVSVDVAKRLGQAYRVGAKTFFIRIWIVEGMSVRGICGCGTASMD